ncbi:hypothetical protein [Thiopseudomonas acetoxidans]|uniref:Uncharacterized protein n=1 Tax=Thiopseudomonas acetoxidans TaxID=3041622 RepID=A0ABT7SMM0_9GAMM|nr:hypothetical protein [Thiopseudomonas sp. CY1220]MDM7857442.1 hypothetical protein [Thiopseudomonas sp. CY1220]
MAGKLYAPNSFWDYMVESFAGTHDTIGGDITGLYDEQGNTTRGRSEKIKLIYEAWSAIAILPSAPSAPFALSEALPSEAWQVLNILIKGDVN